MTYQPQVHDNQIKRKLTTTFSQSELKKPFRSTLLVKSCRLGEAKETRAANNIGRKISISTVSLTGIRPPSSAYGNNKAVDGIISKWPLSVATNLGGIQEFRGKKLQEILGFDIGRANLVARIVTTQNHVFFLYDHYGSRGFDPPFFLKPHPHVRSEQARVRGFSGPDREYIVKSSHFLLSHHIRSM